MSDFKPWPYKRSALRQARIDAANANMVKRCNKLKKAMLTSFDGVGRGESILGKTFMLPSIFKNREEYVYFEHGKYLRFEDGTVKQDVYHRYVAYQLLKHSYHSRGFELTLHFKESFTCVVMSQVKPGDERAYYRKTDPKDPSAVVLKKKTVRFAQGSKP